MASTDKVLGRASKWATLVLLGGVLAVPFLPAPKTTERIAPVAPHAVRSAPGAEKPARAAAPAAVAPGAGEAEPVEGVWSESEIASGLRKCLSLMAPISAEVTLEEPIKKGPCGSPAPLLLRSIGGSAKVKLNPAPTMNCRLAARFSQWVETVLQPAAREVLGSRITRIVGASSYACRNIYNRAKGPLSEHATGSAIDVGRFVTADGRTISVKRGWGPTERDIVAAKEKAADAKDDAAKKGQNDMETAEIGERAATIEAPKKKPDPKEQGKVHKTGLSKDEVQPAATSVAVTMTAAKTRESAFLKRLHSGACAMFGTVLGPEANDAHRDHFHFDVKERRRRGVCH
jgi:hypothetical protein